LIEGGGETMANRLVRDDVVINRMLALDARLKSENPDAGNPLQDELAVWLGVKPASEVYIDLSDEAISISVSGNPYRRMSEKAMRSFLDAMEFDGNG
jgi:hypothetical protein